MNATGIILILLIFLWSITKTLEKITDNIMKKQTRQIELLEEISSKLEVISDQR